MDTANTTLIVLAIVALLIVLGVAAMVRSRRQRTKRLQEQFGAEYDRMLDKLGDETQAERELEERLAHARALNIRALSAEEKDQYELEWQQIQGGFIDEPFLTLQKAERLMQEVMREKGYPVEDFEERAGLLSVYYPELVNEYRLLHRIAIKQVNDDVNTEDMRQAIVHGRTLFEHLMKQEPNEETMNQKERI